MSVIYRFGTTMAHIILAAFVRRIAGSIICAFAFAVPSYAAIAVQDTTPDAPQTATKVDHKEKQPHIIMIYGSYPSHVRKENGEMKGLLPAYFDKIAKGAGIRITWVNSVNWESVLRKNRPNFCDNGLVKNKEREKFVQFTLPIGQISKYVVLSHGDHKELLEYKSLKQTIEQSPLKLSMVKKIFYGSKLNGLKANPKVEILDVTTPRLIAMVKSKLADYALVPEKAGLYNQAKSKKKGALIVIDHYTELQGYRPIYHIACTKSTPPALIEKMNEQIKKLGFVE